MFMECMKSSYISCIGVQLLLFRKELEKDAKPIYSVTNPEVAEQKSVFALVLTQNMLILCRIRQFKTIDNC